MSVRTTRSDGTALPTTSRYDLLLVLLPIPVLLGGSIALMTDVPDPLGLGVGSLPSVALLIYAITAAAPTTTGRSA
jgi:hypothetical protein